MELQPGLFVHNAAAMRMALEHMRTTLSQEDWLLLRQEMKRIGVLIPKQIKKEKNNTKKKFVENIIVENIIVENTVVEDIIVEDSCPICCDHHLKTDCVTTSCGHCFGKECFHLWAQTKQDTHFNTGFASQNRVLNGDFVPTHVVGQNKILQTEVTCPLCVAVVEYLVREA